MLIGLDVELGDALSSAFTSQAGELSAVSLRLA